MCSKELEKLEEKRRKHREQRMEFVTKWAEYVGNNQGDWSKQQKVVVEQ